MEESGDQGLLTVKPFQLKQLLATLTSPRTIPHVALLVILSSALYLVSTSLGSRYAGAVGFTSLAAGYVITALMTRFEAIRENLKLPTWGEVEVSNFLLSCLRALAIPLTLTALISTLLAITLNEQVSEWLPAALAAMFILWSFGQSISFTSGTSGWLAGFEAVSSSESRDSWLGGKPLMEVAVTLILAIGLSFFFSSGFTSDSSAVWLAFPVCASIPVVVVFWLTRELREEASTSRGGVWFSTAYGTFAFAFVVWHLSSAWRRFFNEPSPLGMALEEVFLMVVTVLMAIWTLSSRSVSRGGKTFTDENALYWGLAFGFAYAGSIAMITSYADNVSEDANMATTMAIGHLLTALGLLVLYPRALKGHLRTISE